MGAEDELVAGLEVVRVVLHETRAAEEAAPEADYLCAGPVWETPTKPGRPAAGLDHVRYAAKSGEKRPWFAIGGINGGNLSEVLDAGATRIVVVRAVTEGSDPRSAAAALSGALSEVNGFDDL